MFRQERFHIPGVGGAKCMEGEESGHAKSEAILCWDVNDEDGQHAETSVTLEASASCSQISQRSLNQYIYYMSVIFMM